MARFTDFQLLVLEKQHVSCDDAVELLSELYDDVLPHTLKGRINGHLSECEECGDFYKEFVQGMEFVANDDDLEMPTGVQNRLRQALNERLGLSLPEVRE